jgi:CRP-like cAMP-binding protein
LRHVPSGELIFSPGDPGDAMYFVESGQVEIVSEDEERREALARLIPGDFFGEMALMTGAPSRLAHWPTATCGSSIAPTLTTSWSGIRP